ncbi:protein LEAD-SENSITIVE 1-like [Salvia miltiorrhiza]|uniref:protein LEAD-SENSITIVE 1-like n=1 Tax=Salvia miltiorrhiza TaxID=226208 RepID=UPI0025ACF3E2|nr:protein LEAD-SENSITIVE 1-like [Salvia miltiorrhiza]
MGLVSHRVEMRHLKAGDHIYSYRSAFLYSHHGIYKGEGQVIHFTSSSSSSVHRREVCSACEMLEHSERSSGVIVSCVECFLKSGSLRRYKYGVKKKSYFMKRRGTCNTAEPGPVEVVLERAESLLAQNGFGDYHVLQNNCEDFATYCKTGQGCSRNGTARRYGQASVLPLGLASRR